MKKYILLLSLLFLLGCSSTPVSTIEKVYCTPPPQFMLKADKLAPIKADKGTKVTLEHLIDIWIDDIDSYNNLKSKDDALIDWIHDHCQSE
jgi:energy-converting hydrogenase Eha subunit F